MAQRKLEFHDDSVSPSRTTTFGRSASYSRARTSLTLLRSWPASERSSDFELLKPSSNSTTAPTKVSVTHHDKRRTYMCDSVLAGADNTQSAMHDLVGKPVVTAALQGFNRCVIAYGATGTGKTRTVFGADDGTEKGLVPWVLERLVESRQSSVADDGIISINFSMVELYAGLKNDANICDLLNKRAELVIRQRDQRFELEHAESRGKGPDTRHITSVSQMEEVLKQGLQRRKTAETPRNQKSSRGHVIVTVHVRSRRCGSLYDSVLRFVDLAGNEPGGLTEETPFINSSLSALSHVLGSLSRQCDIPRFRDHPLTLLLKSCLEGNHCFCFLVATVDPRNTTQTIATLDWVSATRRMVATTQVLNRPLSMGRVGNDAECSSLDEQVALIQALREENAKLKELLLSGRHQHSVAVDIPIVASASSSPLFVRRGHTKKASDDDDDDSIVPCHRDVTLCNPSSPDPMSPAASLEYEDELRQERHVPSVATTPIRLTEPACTVTREVHIEANVIPPRSSSQAVQCEVKAPSCAADTQTMKPSTRACQTEFESTAARSSQTESTWRGRQTKNVAIAASSTCSTEIQCDVRGAVVDRYDRATLTVHGSADQSAQTNLAPLCACVAVQASVCLSSSECQASLQVPSSSTSTMTMVKAFADAQCSAVTPPPPQTNDTAASTTILVLKEVATNTQVAPACDEKEEATPTRSALQQDVSDEKIPEERIRSSDSQPPPPTTSSAQLGHNNVDPVHNLTAQKTELLASSASAGRQCLARIVVMLLVLMAAVVCVEITVESPPVRHRAAPVRPSPLYPMCLMHQALEGRHNDTWQYSRRQCKARDPKDDPTPQPPTQPYRTGWWFIDVWLALWTY